MSKIRFVSFSFLLLLLASPATSVGNNIDDDDPTVIEALDYEYFKQKKPEEISRNCKTSVMLSYGLGADATSLGERNEICPNVQQNCCGVQDQKRMKALWKKNTKRMAIHYKTVLFIYKYILGNGKKYAEIAGKISTIFNDANEAAKNNVAPGKSDPAKSTGGSQAVSYKADKVCAKAADKIIGWGFHDRPLAEMYYHAINDRVQFLHNSRRGFYCMLCSIEGQNAIYNSPWLFRWIYTDRIYYNREFCQMLVDHSFRITYELAKTFNHYLRSLIQITTCISLGGGKGTDAKGGPANPAGTLSPAVKIMLNNPLDLGDWGWLELCDLASGSNFLVFEKCEYWCQKWNIAKPKSLFDGNAKSMRRLYDYLLTFEPALRSPDSNLFKDDMVKLKTDINIILTKGLTITKFLYPISATNDLSKYKSDFVYSSKGVNPMEIGKGNTFPFSYQFEAVLKVAALVSVLLWV